MVGTRLLLGVLVLGLVTGCGAELRKLGDSMNGVLEGKNDERASALAKIRDHKDKAVKAGVPADEAGWQAAHKEWRYGFIETAGFESHCEKNADSAECKSVAEEKTAITQGWSEFLRKSMADKGLAVAFNVLSPAVFQAEYDLFPALGADMNAWVPDLAGRKQTYWQQRIQKVASVREHVRREADGGICVFSTKAVGEATSDASALKYAFTKDDGEIHITVVAPQAIASYKRNAPDYLFFDVSTSGASDWHSMDFTLPVATPSKTDLVELHVPAETVQNKLEKVKKGFRKWERGDWVQIRVKYIVPWISGQTLVNSAWVDTWQYLAPASGAFYFKMN